MNWHEFTQGELATFVHEYIHYLQDISMTTGIAQFIHQAKLFQMYIALFSNKSNPIEIPINLEQDGVINSYAYDELLNFYKGGEFQNKKFHHFDCVKLEDEELINEIIINNSDYSGKVEMKRVSIYYDNRKYPTTLGSIYICESMAYLIEKICFSAEVRKNEWPYNVCEMVCEKIYPEILESPKLIVVLCEFALMHRNSGLAFYEALHCLKKLNISNLSAKMVMNILEKSMTEGIEKLNSEFKELDDRINCLYPDKIYLFANTYVKTIYEAGHNYRNGKHFFISEILFADNPSEVIKYWIKLFPFPLLIDQVDHDFFGSYEGLEILPVPLAIKDYFNKPSLGCPLMDYCKYSGNKNLDEKMCREFPWKQCEKEKKCPFAIYLSHYGLDNKSFIINNKS